MTEWNASGYTRIAALQEAMAAEALSLFQVRGSERVLDVGCGNGKVTSNIATRLPQGSMIGVDPSAEMVAYAQEHFPVSAYPNLRFEQGDARTLRFRAEFDLVVSFNALHWIPDQEAALRSIRAAIKADGRAQFRLVADGKRKSLETVLEETRKSELWSRYFDGFHDPYLHLTPERYGALAERTGWRVEQIRTEDRVWDFKSRAEFFAFGMVTFVEWSKRLPEEQRPKFVDDVLTHYQHVAAEKPGEENTFKFYQMDVTLSADPQYQPAR